MFGTEKMRKDGNETPFQKWCGLCDDEHTVAVINRGNYGGSAEKNQMFVNLLRTAVYSAHPNELGRPIAIHDRMHEHMDMGESDFSFRIIADCKNIDAEADVFNKTPHILSFFPSGDGEIKKNGIEIDNKNVLLSSIQKVDGKNLVRFYNSSDMDEKCEISLNNVVHKIELSPYEIKTYIEMENSLNETNIFGEIL